MGLTFEENHEYIPVLTDYPRRCILKKCTSKHARMREPRHTHQEMFTVYKHKTHTSHPVHCTCDFVQQTVTYQAQFKPVNTFYRNT